MTAERNTILKLRGIDEWIAFDGTKYHLTGERENARPMTEQEVNEVTTEWEPRIGIKLEKQDWIIINATHNDE
jgi:hypothetical protein